MNAMIVEPDYLRRDQDRHGNWRIYVRKNGRSIRIRERPGSPEFMAACADALVALDSQAAADTPERRKAPSRGTLAWLGMLYFSSAEFKALDATSRKTRRSILEQCFEEPTKPGAKTLVGRTPLSLVSPATIRLLRDRKAKKPGAANNRLKYLSAMYGWAIEAAIVNTTNPARDIKPIKYASEGFAPWSVEDVEKFEKRHPIGTKARLALALLLYTGVRRGDLVTLGKQHVKDGWLRFVPRKTRHIRAQVSEKPVIDPLERIIAASPTGNLTFLVTEYGKPFTAAGFGGWFKKRCKEAELANRTAHGLRKAGAIMAAEAGATDRQLMAIFDWTSASQASVYTAKAERRKLAGSAMKLLGGGAS